MQDEDNENGKGLSTTPWSETLCTFALTPFMQFEVDEDRPFFWGQEPKRGASPLL
jgi:hypothetical protein